MPIVAMPDGAQVSFPDDMPNEQIKGLIASKFPDAVKLISQGKTTASSQPPEPSFISNIGQDLSKRISTAKDIQQGKYGQDTVDQPALLTGAQQIGNVAGGIGDVVGEGIKSLTKTAYDALPDSAQQSITKSAHSIARSDLGQKGIEALKMGGDVWDAFAEKNPVVARTLGAIGNVAAISPLGGVAKAAPEAIGDAALLARKGVDAVTPAAKELPQSVAKMQPLVDAKGSTLFSKNPNPLESGLEANQKISQMYDVAQTRTKEAAQTARTVGDVTPIEAPDVYDKLDRTIGSLENKVAPGSPEAKALDQLTSIRDSLTKKNPIIASTAGERVAPRTILPSDLMDIEKAINAGIADNKFLTSGAGKSLSFKATVQDAITKAGEINPDFAAKYADYKTEATNLMKTFVDNDSIKPFWQPEDYVSWKANKNNPAASPISDATMSRANKILDNLNTKDLGKVGAVIAALPEEQGRQLMRDAFVRANKEKISLGNAVVKLLTGHIGDAAATALKSITTKGNAPNISNAIKSLERMKRAPGPVTQAASPVYKQATQQETITPLSSNTPREDTRFDTNGNYIKPKKPTLALPAPRKDPIVYGQKGESRLGTDKTFSPTVTPAPEGQKLLPAPNYSSDVMKITQGGRAIPMSKAEVEAANAERTRRADLGYTPDVASVQKSNQISKAYEALNAHKEELKSNAIEQLYNSGKISVHEAMELSKQNLEEIEKLVGKGGVSNLGQALMAAAKKVKK